MNKQVAKGWAHISDSRGAVRLSIVLRVLVIIGVAFVTTLSLSQHSVSAAQSASSYCGGHYSDKDQNTACMSGSSGQNCDDYSTIFQGQPNVGDIVNACKAGKSAKQNNVISDASSSPSTTTSSASSDVCSNYNGSLLQACQGGKIYGCNPSAATTDANLYAACQAGANQAGQASSTATKNTVAYKNAILQACGQYQNNPTSWSNCVYGGMGGNANTTPSVSDCVTNSKITDQNACMSGAQAGSNYFQNSSLLSSSNNSNPFAAQDQQDSVNNLSSLIDVLHSQGSDANTNTSLQSDNNYASYVNGAGKQQPIKVMPCTTDPTAKTATAAPGAAGGSGLTQDQVKQAVTQALQQQSLANNSNFNNSSVNNAFGNGNSSGGTGSTDSSAAIASVAQSIAGILNNNNSNAGTNNNSGSSSVANAGTIASTLSSLLGSSNGSGNTGTGTNSNSGNLSNLSNILNSAQGISSLTQALQGSGADSGPAPGTEGKKCPAIVFFNGGGWHSDDGTSDKVASGAANDGDDQDKGAKPAGGGANARGYTAIEVTYRLGSSGVNYMFEDVMRGLRHVINNASKYGIDATKVAVWGDSAGGSLSMRVAASGKSGAKAAVGWSAPTNAFTALFKSYKSFLIGLDHSTCAPTDLAGVTNTLSGLNGGSINVAQYGQGIGSNDFSALGFSQYGAGGISGFDANNFNPVQSLSQVLAAAQQAQTASKNWEAISNALQQNAQSDADKEKNATSILQDTNHDGTVSADELAAYNAKIKTEEDTNGDGTVSADEAAAFKAARDTNHDGTVSPAEELAYQVAQIKKDEDTNGDGTISDDEAAAYQQKLQKLEDVNGDGTVSPDELATYDQNNPALAEAQKPIADLQKGVINLSAQKLGECFQNFVALSPALFASPETPPSFIAGFDNDDLIDPQQAYDMRDKLNSMGIRAETLIIPGDPNAQQVAFGATTNHLGYDYRFVCPTLNFLDSILMPDKMSNEIDCATGKRPSDTKSANSGGGGSGGSASGCSASFYFKRADSGGPKATLAAAVLPNQQAHLVDPNAQPGDPNFQVYQITPKASTGSSCSSSPSGGGNNNNSSGTGAQQCNVAQLVGATVQPSGPDISQPADVGVGNSASAPVIPPKIDAGPSAKYLNPQPTTPSQSGTYCSSATCKGVTAVSIRLTDALPSCSPSASDAPYTGGAKTNQL